MPAIALISIGLGALVLADLALHTFQAFSMRRKKRQARRGRFLKADEARPHAAPDEGVTWEDARARAARNRRSTGSPKGFTIRW